MDSDSEWEHHGAGMIAVGTGVGEHLELERGEPAVGIGAGLDVDPHRMPRRGRDELLLAGQLQLDRSSGLERRERQNVLDEHLLLAAKAAADAFAEHADLVQGKPKDVRQRAACQERHLRGGTDIEHAGSIEPGEAAMGLQRGVLHAMTVEGRLIGDGRRRECRRHVAVFAMGLRREVTLGIGDAVRGGAVRMNDRCTRRHRLLRIDQRRQDFVIDLQPPARLLGGGLALGDDGGDLLADEADDVIEDAGILRIHPVLLMPRRRDQHRRRILMRQDRVHAGHAQRVRLVDRDDFRVGVRRAQQLDVQ
ncbi:hypothetical protein ACVW0J_004131 [Bradyrhizobium sp. i1.7.7]